MNKKAVSNGGGFNFGDTSAYSTGGAFVPNGDYAMTDLTVKMHDYKKADGTSAGTGLVVMITFQPLAGGDPVEQPYGLGRKAHESWQPDPETGKRLVPVEGGPGTAPNAITNWGIFHKSLIDSGLPNGVLQDDLSVLEGTWVHIENVPEPEERKGFKSNTGEAATETRNKTIAVVTEIKDDGKPWEGSGGIPAEQAAPKPAAAKPAASAKPQAVAAKPSAQPSRTAAPVQNDDEVESIASDAVYNVLKAGATTVLKLRTTVFKTVKEKHDLLMTQKVMDSFFSTDDKLNLLLEPFGYVVKGKDVVAA